MSEPSRGRIFLLSPANCAGVRAQMLLRGGGELAARLREGALPLGEICAFLSSLYFRGKLAYARAFAAPPRGAAGAYVMTSHRGLVPAATPITHAELRAMAEVPIDLAEPRYVEPMRATAWEVRERCGSGVEVVLLGSVATGKYVDCLLPIFGNRLLFPVDFVGRGDMSRGGLMLRCAAEGRELAYVPIHQAVRRGKRPPKLAPR